MNNVKLLLLLVILCLSSSCIKVNSNNKIVTKEFNSSNQTQNTKIPNNFPTDSGNIIIAQVDKKLYLGCWSSGNANVAYIKPTTLQTRNSYKALKYKDVTDDVTKEKGVYLLEIVDLDESNELQKYVALKVLPNDEMEGKDYDSYNAFVNNNESGRHAKWVRDKCETVLQFMK